MERKRVNKDIVQRAAQGGLFVIAAAVAWPSHAQQYNAAPSRDNPYNTLVDKTASSPGFRCGTRVVTVWANSSGDLYAAFSDDRHWYRVEKVSMHPLLYTAYSLGRKVCYQTKGYPADDIAVNVVFFDPRD